MSMRRSRSTSATQEQLWIWAFWASIAMCEVVGLLLTHRA